MKLRLQSNEKLKTLDIITRDHHMTTRYSKLVIDAIARAMVDKHLQEQIVGLGVNLTKVPYPQKINFRQLTFFPMATK